MDDLISRHAVLTEIFKKPAWHNSDGSYYHSDDIRDAVNSVKPQEQTGHWKIIDDCEHFIAKCSECGRIEDSRMVGKYPYCHCGARMVEPQESEG